MEPPGTNPRRGQESELKSALHQARTVLLGQRTGEGIWEGELSPSALATATAVMALELVRNQSSVEDPRLVKCAEAGARWLESHANTDGGWGDTLKSRSNISTTTLVWAALGKCGAPAAQTVSAEPSRSSARNQALAGAEHWLRQAAGGLEPERISAKILERYGSDRTFSAPILTHCALAGRLGQGRAAWRYVIPLPFELAAFPAEWFGALRLPVVSYALPALIAIGYARHYHAPSANPLLRWIRSLVTERVFRVLEAIQPSNGGFLEAIPLTSFVLMSLAGSGKAGHPVAQRGLEFILNSAQADGSWKIDTNLSTFVTTLAIQGLGSSASHLLTETEQDRITDWLLGQQYRVRHPYTNAAPGGWAWTPLPGGVPDADDTAGALLALKRLPISGETTRNAIQSGLTWLMNLQNRDGGIPTFCRGWGKLPFDRSSPDLTAHSLRAWSAWEADLPQAMKNRLAMAKARAVDFLKRTQESNGSWSPLWFGNQFEADETNRVYGTSRVLLALAETGTCLESAGKAVRWLSQTQKPDGGWSGGEGQGPSSTEETALALEGLCAVVECWPELRPEMAASLRRGLAHLLSRIAGQSWIDPTPIGFYFAKLWYYEKLYPLIFTVAALERVNSISPWD